MNKTKIEAANILANIIDTGGTSEIKLSLRSTETFTEDQLTDAVWVHKAILADIAKMKYTFESDYPNSEIEYFISGEDKDTPTVQRIFPLPNKFETPFVIRVELLQELYRIDIILRAKITQTV